MVFPDGDDGVADVFIAVWHVGAFSPNVTQDGERISDFVSINAA